MNDWPQEWILEIRLFQDHAAQVFHMQYSARHTKTKKSVGSNFGLDVTPEEGIAHIKQIIENT